MHNLFCRTARVLAGLVAELIGASEDAAGTFECKFSPRGRARSGRRLCTATMEAQMIDLIAKLLVVAFTFGVGLLFAVWPERVSSTFNRWNGHGEQLREGKPGGSHRYPREMGIFLFGLTGFVLVAQRCLVSKIVVEIWWFGRDSRVSFSCCEKLFLRNCVYISSSVLS